MSADVAVKANLRIASRSRKERSVSVAGGNPTDKHPDERRAHPLDDHFPNSWVASKSLTERSWAETRTVTLTGLGLQHLCVTCCFEGY